MSGTRNKNGKIWEILTLFIRDAISCKGLGSVNLFKIMKTAQAWVFLIRIKLNWVCHVQNIVSRR